MNDSLIDPIGAGPVATPRVDAENRQLREACQKFEGMLLGIMMKESLGESMLESSEGEGGGLDSFREFCIEQVANTMAESSSLGIADQLYAELGMEGGKQ